jgi:hypothetical protein
MARANGINCHLAGEYFVATSDEARKKVKQYATRGIVNLTSVRSAEFIERWDKIEAGMTEPGVGKRRRGSA